MRKPRETTLLADRAEAERDRTIREVVVPLRRMRQGDYLTKAVADDIRRQQREGT